MEIAVLGSGRVGGTLADGLTRAGHVVRIGSRDPRSNKHSPTAPIFSLAEAAAGATVVINATPGSVSVATLTSQPLGWLDDKVLLDVSNADDGAGKMTYSDGSLAERLQEAFPSTAVVKSLNTFNRTIMVNPGLLPEPTTVFVSGDDRGAKSTVGSLLGDLGWHESQILDLGQLSTARSVENLIQLYYAVRDAVGTRDFNYRVVPSDERAPLTSD